MDDSVYESMSFESACFPFFERHLDDEFGKGKWKIMPGKVQKAIKGCGDALCVRGEKDQMQIEAKFDKTRHPNLFLEDYHVWPGGARSVGWIHTTRANWLWYFWVSQGLLMKVPMMRLCYWFDLNRGRFKTKKQGAVFQTAESYGMCVSRDIIAAEIPGAIRVPFDNAGWDRDKA